MFYFLTKNGGGGGSRTPVPIKPIQDLYMLSQAKLLIPG